jgi:hypothetical protein
MIFWELQGAIAKAQVAWPVLESHGSPGSIEHNGKQYVTVTSGTGAVYVRPTRTGCMSRPAGHCGPSRCLISRPLEHHAEAAP